MGPIGPGSPGWNEAVAKMRELLARGQISKEEMIKAIQEASQQFNSYSTVGGPRPNQTAKYHEIAEVQRLLKDGLIQLGIDVTKMPDASYFANAVQGGLPLAAAFGSSIQAVAPVAINSAFLGRSFAASRGMSSSAGLAGTGTVATVGGALLALAALCYALNEVHEKIKRDSAAYSEMRDRAAIAWMQANLEMFSGGPQPSYFRPRVAR